MRFLSQLLITNRAIHRPHAAPAAIPTMMTGSFRKMVDTPITDRTAEPTIRVAPKNDCSERSSCLFDKRATLLVPHDTNS